MGAYRVAVEGEGVVAKGRTLFEACLVAKGTHGANVVTPEGRLVAFWCGWRKCVAVGFGAHPYERHEVEEAFGVAPAL